MTQTLALLVDAYRDLNSKKLFWLVLILSIMFAACFACIVATPGGIYVLHWKLSLPPGAGHISNAALQKGFFFYFGVKYWLTWIASILAIISTAGIFPSLITGGTIELFLSKPISRLRLFLAKYLFGLLFVALQIACYCLASFLVIGLRGRAWEPAIFLAVPIVLLFYSYLFCVCVLFGVMTRSTVAAILLTLLFWMMVWAVAVVEEQTLIAKMESATEIAELDGRIGDLQKQLEPSGTTRPSGDVAALKSQFQLMQTRRDELQKTGEPWHQASLRIENFLPKTSATISLLQRELIERARLPVPSLESDSELKAEAQIRDRPIRWTVGTSLAFEGAILVLAAWIFCRRDY